MMEIFNKLHLIFRFLDSPFSTEIPSLKHCVIAFTLLAKGEFSRVSFCSCFIKKSFKKTVVFQLLALFHLLIFLIFVSYFIYFKINKSFVK